MALTLEQKKAVVSEIAKVAEIAHSLVAAEYRGSSVDSMTAMRADARKNGVYLKVVKNTLVRRAVQNTEYECISDALVGPLLFAFSQEDPGCAARLIKDHAKENDKLEVKFLAVGGQMLPASELKRLASLPTKDEAIAMLMAVMKAPIEKLARTLNEPHAKLTRTIAAVKEQKAA